MTVSPMQKQQFISWYLNHFQTDRREMVWLLEYVMKRNHLLDHIHFVYEAHLCPRSLIISSLPEEKRPFRYYKDHVVTTDVDKAFHDIRLNSEETLYIEIIYEGVRQSIQYAHVLEDNPYLPEDYYLENDDYILLENFLDRSTINSKINLIRNKIDHALDRGDVESFKKWSKELNKIKQSKE